MTTRLSNVHISIDPGSVGTGLAIFHHGRFVEASTIWLKKEGTVQKMATLQKRLREFLEHFESVDRIAIEAWGKHIERYKFVSMLACAEARGVILATCLEFTNRIIYVSKGNKPKMEAELIAKQLGVEESEHAKDAIHLGILAGFSLL